MNSLSPPEAAMSGWAMSTQGPSGRTNKSRKPYLESRLSKYLDKPILYIPHEAAFASCNGDTSLGHDSGVTLNVMINNLLDGFHSQYLDIFWYYRLLKP